ncbi:MAG: ComEA family DNA-binding protein [Oscillospiraceae bacterium]|jgi:comEA protein|nr:ComEA family DNA-binding protein [Oscillospiraceae bacterium]
MRLRRLELTIIALTLAFICFMGGYFTGRNQNSVNVMAVHGQTNDTQSGLTITTQNNTQAEQQSKNTENQTTANTNEHHVNNNQTEQGTNTGLAKGGDGKININLATQGELTDLPGIGATLATRIVDYRRQHGDFQTIEELRQVSGIGEKRYEAISDLITVG